MLRPGKMIDVRWRWKWHLWHWFYVISIYNAYITTSAHSRLVCRTRLHEPRVYEGAPAGQYVMTVRAYDEFGASHIIYRLVQGRDMFFVEEDTGRLNTAKKIEKRVGETYNLLLVAVSGGQTESCPVEVQVTRLNRHAPVFRLPLYRVEIPHVAPLRSVLLNVAAVDSDLEPYNSEIYYFLSQISKEDRGVSFSSTTWSSAINPFDGNKQEPDEWMNAELDREDESLGANLSLTNQSLSSGWGQMKDRWVTVDRRSGAIYLNRALHKNIGLLRAKVLAVDGGSPPRWASTTLEVLIKTIGPPLNLTVNNITETNVRVCWRKPSIGDPKGFLVRFRSSRNDNNQSVQDHTLNVTQGVSERPSCVYLTSLKPATDYELKVYGWRDEEVGMGSDIALFNTLTPRCLSQNMCGNGTCHPGPSLTSPTTVRNYYCECQDGFYGDACQYFNPCALQPCLNMGTCVNTSNEHYRCECVVGFYDDNCSSFDPCANVNVGYCFNSGSCVSNSSHVYVCACPLGFYGSKCEKMDPCAIRKDSEICFNGGTCRNTTASDYVCDCTPGFAGSQCESNINDCSSSTCMNAGSCIDGINSFTCNCAEGFTGALCQDEVNGCNTKQCENGAVCEKRENNFVCLCPPGFFGDLCDQKTDFCKSSPCSNGGSCKNRNNQFDCLCLPEFQGTSCELLAVCLEESIAVSEGIFRFNKTLTGEAVKFKCPFGPPDVVLERQCITVLSHSNASWTQFNFAKCRQQDMMEAENVTMQLLEMTKNGSLLGPREINEVTEKIEVILDYAIRDTKIAKFMFGVISNLLDANETSFTDESYNTASTRLVRLIENFIQGVDVRDQMQINTDNLVVQIQTVTPPESHESNDVVFQGLHSKMPFRNASNEVEEVPTMTVSSSVIEKAARQVKNVRLHFVAHKNAKLFREKDHSRATMDRATLSDRPVFSVSVANFNVTDMTNGVNYTIKKPLYGQWLCVYWIMDDSEVPYGKWSTKGMTAFQNDEEITCSSNHMTSFSILLDPDPDEPIDPVQEKALSIISYIGSGLSVLGLVFTILTFSMFRCLNRDRSGKILLNLCVSMLLLNVSFLSGAFKSDELKKVGDVTQDSSNPGGENSTNNTVLNSSYEKNALCTAVAVFTHYFLLTTLAWMTVEAINMYQLLIYVFATSESRFLLKRLFVAWGAPAVIVGVTAAVDIQYYNPTNQYCMLSATNPYVYYLTLLVPCCILLIVNTVVFIMVTKVLFQPRNGNGTLPHKNLSNNKWKVKNIVTFPQVRGAFTVMTLLGITWVFGALAFGPARTVFQYIFCVLNSLQGFLVFVVRCLQYPEARSAWYQFFRTGTLKKHRGTKITTTNSSNNSHVKLTLSNVASSNSGSANTNNNVRERSSSTITTCSVNERGFRQLHTAASGSANKNTEGGISTPSSWVYGGNEAKKNGNDTYEEVQANNNTKANGEPTADTKEGHYTNWEYMTWQKKRDEELAEEEKQGFKSVWLVRDATPSPMRLSVGAEDAPFIEEEEDKQSDETLVAETVMKRRGGTLTDQGYGSAEHSPSSKRDEMTEHVL